MRGGSGRQSDRVRYSVTNTNLAPYSSAIPLIGYPETLAKRVKQKMPPAAFLDAFEGKSNQVCPLI